MHLCMSVRELCVHVGDHCQSATEPPYEIIVETKWKYFMNWKVPYSYYMLLFSLYTNSHFSNVRNIILMLPAI